MRIERVERLNLAFSAGAVAASWALASPAFAGGIAAGALLEAANFRGLFRAGLRLFSGHSQRWAAGWSLRFLLLGVGIAVSLWAGAHPVGLVVGLSAIIPAAVLEAWRARPPVDAEASALAPDDPTWEHWNAWLAREREDAEEPEQ